MLEEERKKLESQFNDAVERSNKLPKQSTDVQLELYSFYKQALFGDATGERPGRTKVKARAKFDRWVSRKGMSKEDAMKEYIALVNKLENT
ncbi:MAG: acyl-CoA-binding protein [Promethearchaeota archaeon]